MGHVVILIDIHLKKINQEKFGIEMQIVKVDQEGTDKEEIKITDIVKPPKQSNRKSFLRSPEPWEVKRLKVYSETELDLTVGKTKEYCKFWNFEVKGVPNYTLINKRKI